MAIIGASFPRLVLSPWYGDPQVFRVKCASGLNPTLIAGRPANIASIVLCNHAASERFIHFYDSPIAPTPATTPLLFSLSIEQSVSPLVISVTGGIPFAAGLAYSLTTAVGESGSCSADDLVGFITWSAYT